MGIKHRRSFTKKHQEQLADSERELFLNAFYQGEYADPKGVEGHTEPPSSREVKKHRVEEQDQDRALFLEAIEHGLPKNHKKNNLDTLVKGPKKAARKNNLVDATLDLHGQNAEDAALLLRKFIEKHKKLGNKTLLIIHGIGSGILRKAMWSIAETHPDVDDFQGAPGKMGGAGALIVRINRHVKR